MKEPLKFSPGVNSEATTAVESPAAVCCGLNGQALDPSGSECSAEGLRAGTLRSDRNTAGRGQGLLRPGRRRGCLRRHCCGHRAGLCNAGSWCQGSRRSGRGPWAVSYLSGCEWGLSLGLWCARQEGGRRRRLKIDCGRGRFHVRRAGDCLNQIDGWLQNQFPAGGANFRRNFVGEHCQQRHNDHADEQQESPDFHQRCVVEQAREEAADPDQPSWAVNEAWTIAANWTRNNANLAKPGGLASLRRAYSVTGRGSGVCRSQKSIGSRETPSGSRQPN